MDIEAVLLVHQKRIVLVLNIWRLWDLDVGFEDVIKVQSDGADVERPNEAHGEEAVGPLAKQVHALILFEDVLVAL